MVVHAGQIGTLYCGGLTKPGWGKMNLSSSCTTANKATSSSQACLVFAACFALFACGFLLAETIEAAAHDITQHLTTHSLNIHEPQTSNSMNLRYIQTCPGVAACKNALTVRIFTATVLHSQKPLQCSCIFLVSCMHRLLNWWARLLSTRRFDIFCFCTPQKGLLSNLLA